MFGINPLFLLFRSQNAIHKCLPEDKYVVAAEAVLEHHFDVHTDCRAWCPRKQWAHSMSALLEPIRRALVKVTLQDDVKKKRRYRLSASGFGQYLGQALQLP